MSDEWNRLPNSADMKLVPLLVGSVSESAAAEYAEVFQEYWEDDETFWVISSDFCHWYVDSILSAPAPADSSYYVLGEQDSATRHTTQTLLQSSTPCPLLRVLDRLRQRRHCLLN